MSSDQSLLNQAHWCKTTYEHLENLQGSIINIGREYYNCCEELKSSGYMSEYMRTLDAKMREFVDHAEATRLHIENEHKAYIAAQKKVVAQKLQENENRASVIQSQFDTIKSWKQP